MKRPFLSRVKSFKLKNNIVMKTLFLLIAVVFCYHFKLKNELIFTAKFYDDSGHYIGSYGQTDKQSPIYIVSCEKLFPDKFKANNTTMTPQEIVELVGIEVLENRQHHVSELREFKGIFKLPPKEHRQAIKKAIEETHLDAQIPHKIDSIDYEIGGCGYHNNQGQFFHLRAEDGEHSKGLKPGIAIFNAVDYDKLVDKVHQIITDRGSKLINEKQIEYTWHTHPPKINGSISEQMPSLSDFRFASSYPFIKQHFLISVKYKTVYYYGLGVLLPSSGEAGGYHFKINYDQFFDLE
jgi:hypothetical protein